MKSEKTYENTRVFYTETTPKETSAFVNEGYERCKPTDNTHQYDSIDLKDFNNKILCFNDEDSVRGKSFKGSSQQCSRPFLILSIVSILLLATSIPVTYLVVKWKYSAWISQEYDTCEWTSWSNWAHCTVSCGEGSEFRLQQQTGTGNCSYNETVELRSCHTGPCPVDPPLCYWTSWSSWTNCQAPCIVGRQSRIKQHVGDVQRCPYDERSESRPCISIECPADKHTIEMKFDPSTLHRDWYVSYDNTILSNYNSSMTPNSPNGIHQLKNYQGVIADICVEDNTRFYYELAYEYTLLTNLSSDTWLVLEVALAERASIDKYNYAGSTNESGWSFHIANNLNNDKLCISAQHDSIYKNTIISKNTAGTSVKGTFTLFIDRITNEFTLLNNGTIFYTFKNVDKFVKLCPVFSVYNKAWLRTTLRIITSKNYTMLP